MPKEAWCSWNNPQRNDKETGRLGNERPNGDHPDYDIIMITQNTEKRLKETCCHSNSRKKPSANTGVKTLKE